MDHVNFCEREFENRYQGFNQEAASKKRTQEGDVAASGIEEGLYFVRNQAWGYMLMARCDSRMVAFG